MPEITEPRSGIKYGWNEGENGWKSGMDENLVKLGRWGFHLTVLDRDVTEPPNSPTPGDTYIVGPLSTGIWSGHDGEITVWDGSAWVFGVPGVGWMAYIQDEEVLSVYKSTGWSAGIAL